MNLYLVALWGSAVFGVLGVVLIIAHLATGQKSMKLQRAAGMCLLLGMLCFGYWRFVA